MIVTSLQMACECDGRDKKACIWLFPLEQRTSNASLKRPRSGFRGFMTLIATGSVPMTSPLKTRPKAADGFRVGDTEAYWEMWNCAVHLEFGSCGCRGMIGLTEINEKDQKQPINPLLRHATYYIWRDMNMIAIT